MGASARRNQEYVWLCDYCKVRTEEEIQDAFAHLDEVSSNSGVFHAGLASADGFN
jgi:hypothetical protein